MSRGQKRVRYEIENYANNQYIKMAVAEYYRSGKAEDYATLLEILLKRMTEDGEVPTPYGGCEPRFGYPAGR